MLSDFGFRCTGQEAADEAGNPKELPFTYSYLADWVEEVREIEETYNLQNPEDEYNLSAAMHAVARRICDIHDLHEGWEDYVVEGFEFLLETNLSNVTAGIRHSKHRWK